MTQNTHIARITATVAGTAMTGIAGWLNAEHIASTEGWFSPMVAASIVLTISGAMALPLSEVARRTGQPFKAACFVAFFALVLAGSLLIAMARTGGYRDNIVATGLQANSRAQLAQDAYTAAQTTVADECKKRGNRCRAAEAALIEARNALARGEAPKPADPAAQRISALFGISEATVAMYSPLLLPLAFEIGGFIFLAFGLAGVTPARPEEPPEVVAEPHTEAMTQLRTIAATARPRSGTREWYMIRLHAEHPHLAARVDSGELSCNKASILAGLRKPRKTAVYHWSTMEHA